MIRHLSFHMLLMVIFVGLTTSAFNIQPVKAEPATIRVPDDYPLIQWAINAANSGDTISVSPGIYDEQIVVNKTVNLVGQDQKTTIIDAHGTGTVVAVTTSMVNVTGFTIRNGEPWGLVGGYIVSNNILESNSAGIKDAKIIKDNIVRNNGAPGALEKMGILGHNSIIVGNTVEENFGGIEGHGSTIQNNLIASNGRIYGGEGLKIGGSIVVGNTIKENHYGVYVSTTGYWGNTIYHNNFIGNEEQVLNYEYFEESSWDNGAEGNYWSDYEGMDGNGDGIGDTLLPHLGVDNYPLVEPWSEVRTFVAYVWNDYTHNVSIRSNITIASFDFDVSKKQISFNATGPTGKIGFTNATIPKTFMWVDSLDEWNITINGAQLSTQRTITYNGTHYFIYFTCNTSTVRIGVIGKYLVPEFSSWIPMLLVLIVFTVASVIYKRRLHRNPINAK